MVKTKLKDIKTEEQSKKISNLKKESVMPVVKTDIKIAKPGMKELVNIDKLEINNLPEGVKVATMCCSCFLGSKLDLDNIEKYMVLNENDILTVKRNKDSIRTLIELKKPSKRNNVDNKKKKDGVNVINNFYNSITLIVRVNEGDTKNINLEPKINIKLFKNGSMQMSGCKNINNVNKVLLKVLERLGQVKGKLEEGEIKEITFTEEIDKLGILNFKIDMIYCNYRISIQIDREKLHELLKKKKVKVIYEPCSRACVIIKYTPNTDNVDNKEVSIFIFKKGNIIITGARSRAQVIEAYNYINNIIITHSEEIIKKSEEEEEGLILDLYEDVMKDVEQGLITI
jgi:TATA-box binding protein (TBP) (component of TFIID and TFIIIB)